MADWSWETISRDFMNRPLFYPLLRIYGAFMNIERYDHMPFYFYPSGVKVSSFEDSFLDFLDWTVDAHEESRNDRDKNRNFYDRSVYVLKNFHRYQNDTVANVMFDTQAPRNVYQRLNSTVGQGNIAFYTSAAAVHSLSFMYMSFFFRYRTIKALPTLAIAGAYYCFFENVNNILYKVLVDKPVLDEAKRLGQQAHLQPVGTRVPRGLNYK